MLLVTQVAVRLDSPGPCLFKQVLVGVNGRRFRLYKARTMRNGNDDRGHRGLIADSTSSAMASTSWLMTRASPASDRTVPCAMTASTSSRNSGTSWRGRHSLVGPSPALPHETELHPAYAWARLQVKPGVTGLWQVSGRCELSRRHGVAHMRYWQQWTPPALGHRDAPGDDRPQRQRRRRVTEPPAGDSELDRPL